MRLDSYAAGESFCLKLAGRMGLTNVETEVVDIDGRPVIVISRYDCQRTATGVTRIHQEYACQALAVDCSDRPGRRYESGGGPSLRDFAAVLTNFAGIAARPSLLALTVLNVIVGNADAHAKNLSILHPADGSTQLAPAYDITPTTFYKQVPTPDGPRDPSDKLGMWINNRRIIHDVTAEDLVAEGTSWGLSGAEALVRAALDDFERTAPEVARDSPIPGGDV